MTRTKDFSSEIESISSSVDSDVGNLMKLIREEAAGVPRSKDVTVDVSAPKQEEQQNASDNTPPEKVAQSRRSRSPQKAALPNEVVLENVTTRLSRDTNELLTEVALRQRLKKCVPASRQDVIETALRYWFRSQGYLK